MATIRRETRKRGLFGWVFLLIFWAFNAFMALMLVLMIGGVGAGSQNVTSEAEAAGYVIGSALGLGTVLFVWVVGAVVLGLFVLFTRGSKVIVEETRT